MISKDDPDGDTAGVKDGDTACLKRKRDPEDDPKQTDKTKKPRRTSKATGQKQRKKEAKQKAEQQAKQRAEPNHAVLTHQPETAALQEIDSDSEVEAPSKPGAWKVSNPMGGRMVDVDPVFSQDEKYLILAYNTSIQVYSTQDSLLVRRISLDVSKMAAGTAYHGLPQIMAVVLSKTSPDHIWVACFNGSIWYLNWTTGTGGDSPVIVESTRVHDISVDAVAIGGTIKDVLLVLKRNTTSTTHVVAYDKEALQNRAGKLIYEYDHGQMLRYAADGKLIIALGKEVLHVGILAKTGWGKLDKLDDLAFRFHSFEAPDRISSYDVRFNEINFKRELKDVDLVVGGARGAKYIYTKLLSKLAGAGGGSGATQVHSLAPRMIHWHRQAVHSVKWSRDGNYLISGGYEAALILTQLDTGAVDFLPHLAAAVENIVVSPSGSSYVVHLDDNSTMVVSTAGLDPTGYISGIQSAVLADRRPKEATVRRVWLPVDEITSPLVAAVNPRNPSQILLGVGYGQQAAQGIGAPSTPLVQVFDVSTFRGLARHAVAETRPSDPNITSEGAPIVEPSTSKLAFSRDGKWLASVDEWEPPERDVEPLLSGTKSLADVCRERREVLLKFWEVGSGDDAPLDLVTTVVDAHPSNQSTAILDIASDPVASRFATIGEDGTVRFWTSKLVRRDGIIPEGPDGRPLRNWSCQRVVSLPRFELRDYWGETPSTAPRSGALAFSEDGSVLFAAFGTQSEGIVVAIDTASWAVRDVVSGMFRGEIRAIKVLSSCLILLSEDLVVYDIVSDELLYSFSLKETTAAAAKKLTQLAVNYESRTFALVAPVPNPIHDRLVRDVKSELVIFSVEDASPQLVHIFPHLITSLLALPGAPGFIIVDSAGQVSSITEGADQATLLQPLADLGIEDAGDEPAATTDLEVAEDEASDEEMQDAEEDVEMEDDYDIHAAVIAPQRLAEIFNVAPAFAMPPIEETFYQIAALLSTKAATS